MTSNCTKITCRYTACLMFDLNRKTNRRVSHIPFYSGSLPPVSSRMESTNSTKKIQNMHFRTFELYSHFTEAVVNCMLKSNIEPEFNIF